MKAGSQPVRPGEIEIGEMRPLYDEKEETEQALCDNDGDEDGLNHGVATDPVSAGSKEDDEKEDQDRAEDRTEDEDAGEDDRDEGEEGRPSRGMGRTVKVTREEREDHERTHTHHSDRGVNTA